ncbi:serine/threonine-protein kinase [Streptomyces sp. NPDC050504]|uniref:serine/threonine-protein kinase n=1 Tax=Streptomyces sp. NPDC050504 TaxID=3365618 RepID=UPI0037B088E8
MTLREGDPRAVGGYRLEGRLGEGGMGVVYRARSVSGRQVAVKVIRPELAADAAFLARFQQEVAAARRVSGAFTAPVVDADADAAAPWLATLFVPGPSLSQRVLEQGPLGAPEVRTLAAGLVEALRDIHRVGLVHRDLKPGNVLLAEDGPRVIDFGIARTSGAAPLTSTGVVVGTPPFMAPEQFRGGTVSPATDVFALGAVLVYAATGHGPFDGDTSHAVGFRVVYEEPDLTGLPDELRELVNACLAKEPAHRITVERLLRTLAGTAHEHDDPRPAAHSPAARPPTLPSAPPAPPAPPVPPPARPATQQPATQRPVPPRSTTQQSAPPHGAPPKSVPPRDAPLKPSPLKPAPPGTRDRSRDRRRTALLAGIAALVVAAAAVTVPKLLDGDDGKGAGGNKGGGDRNNARPSTGASPGTHGPAAPPCAPGALSAAGPGAQKNAVNRWIADYARRCTGSGVTYQPLGTGAGLQMFLSGQVDFAVVDRPVTSAEADRAKERCGTAGAVLLPLSVLPIAVRYNVAGVDRLTLDPAVLARIFAGRITRWNDPAIAALNKGLRLPELDITTVVPDRESGVTRGFTRYLAKAAAEDWPYAPATTMPTTPPGQRASDAPEATTAGLSGAVSFAPTTDARSTGLGNALLAPGGGAPLSVTDAGAVSKSLENAHGSVPVTGGADEEEAGAPGAYPLTQVSYAMVCARGNEPAALPPLRAFLGHAVSGQEQRAAADEGYGTLPRGLAERVQREAAGLS